MNFERAYETRTEKRLKEDYLFDTKMNDLTERNK